MITLLLGGALLPSLLLVVVENLINHDSSFDVGEWLQAIGFLIIGTVALLMVGVSIVMSSNSDI